MSSRAARYRRRSSRVLSWSRRHKLLAAISVLVIAAVPGVAIAAMGDGGGGSPPAAQPTVPSTSPAPSSSVVSSTAPTTTKPPPSRAPTMAAPAVAGAATDGAIKGGIVQLEGGGATTPACGVRRGAVYCWGQGAYGQLGTGTHFRGTPTRTLVVDDAVEIQAGDRFTCARRPIGQVLCWGEDGHAQLGSRDTEPCGDAEIDSVCAPAPQPVKDLSGTQGLATGESHACALLSAGTVSCWGSNEHGQLGDGGTTDRPSPGRVTSITDAQFLAGGRWHFCVIRRNATVWCWGDNLGGQLGTGDVDGTANPVPVAVRNLPRT
jgi:hypothetical protein